MNRAIKETAVKRDHYGNHDQLRTHLTELLEDCKFAQELNAEFPRNISARYKSHSKKHSFLTVSTIYRQ
jgi:hypothetical protein